MKEANLAVIAVECDERLQVADVNSGRKLTAVGFQVRPVRKRGGRVSEVLLVRRPSGVRTPRSATLGAFLAVLVPDSGRTVFHRHLIQRR